MSATNKPLNPYLTEQTRLEAQRRMLAERYGLYSDDSEDDDDDPDPDSTDPQDDDSDPPQPTATATAAAAAAAAAAAPSPPPPPPSASNGGLLPSSVSSPTLPTSETAAAEIIIPKDHPSSGPPSVDALFAPIELLHGSAISSYFNLPLYKKEHPPTPTPAASDYRITQIALYSSQLLQTHNRKIAVSNQILSYAVGGHIRALLRHSSARCLLKGHSSVVADIEFLSYMESKLDNESSDHISILGSVSDDGSVYIWKLIRSSLSSNFNIADAIRFEHPAFEKGGNYKKLSFRPGPNSIIAENGIGVAMLLLDVHSTDLRIVELVKMHDKMMVRDKFLKAKNEVPVPTSPTPTEGRPNDDCIKAAIWLSETKIVTSRNGHVFVWVIDNTFAHCIGYIPRPSTKPVTDIHVVNGNVLVFVVDSGRSIEVWQLLNDGADDNGSGSSTLSLQSNQTIDLFNETYSGDDDSSTSSPETNPADQSASSSSAIHCVSAMDPAQQNLFISNVKKKSVVILHLNKVANAFDSITEVPLKNNIYSLSIAPITAPRVSPASDTSPDAGVELGIWCIQPTGIQVIHLPMSIGKPQSTGIKNEIHPKPVPQPLRSGKQAEKQAVPATIQTIPPTVPTKTEPVRQQRQILSSSGSKSDIKPHQQTRTASSDGDSGVGPTHPPGIKTEIVLLKRSSDGVVKKSPSTETNTSSSSTSAHTTQTTATSAPPGPSSDELISSILSATKKVIASFEESGQQRESNEKAKAEKLIESVAETAESNMEHFINSSMKKVLAETLIPGVSEIIADSRKAMKQRSRLELDLSRQHFEQVLEKAALPAAFAAGCAEMGRQVNAAVTASLNGKFDSVVTPAVDVVNEAVEDLSACVAALREEVRKARNKEEGEEEDDDEVDDDDEEENDEGVNGGDNGVKQQHAGRRKPRRKNNSNNSTNNNNMDNGNAGTAVNENSDTVKEEIESLLLQHKVNEAFLTVLDKEDVSLVLWLCRKLDPQTLFENNPLSQVALMSLAAQLGQQLAVGDDPLTTTSWLQEVMSSLEPNSEEIESIALPAVHNLALVVNDARSDQQLLSQHPGLERKLKMLAHVVASQLGHHHIAVHQQ